MLNEWICQKCAHEAGLVPRPGMLWYTSVSGYPADHYVWRPMDNDGDTCCVCDNDQSYAHLIEAHVMEVDNAKEGTSI